MTLFVLRRLLAIVPMVVIVLSITFLLVSFAPGSPFSRERQLSPQVEARLNAKYGFDEPRWKQYLRFMGRLAGWTKQGNETVWRPFPDFGDSLKYQDRRVSEIIAEALPISAILGITAYGIAVLAGIGAGILAASRKGSRVDRLVTMAATAGVSIPNFVLGPLLVLLFSLTLYVLPPARLEWVQWGSRKLPDWKSLALPCITLSAVYIAYIARITRSSMIEALGKDFIRTAHAKGASRTRILFRHALRSSILPVVSFTGPALAFLLTGTVVVETIFAIPGLGRYLIDAANNRDHFLLLGITAFASLSLMLCNLLVDVLYAILDPRIRYR